MKNFFANFRHHRLVSAGLPMACVLLWAVSGGGESPDHLRLKLHVVWTNEYHMTYAHEGVTGEMTDRVEISYDGLLLATAPAGTMDWDMTTVPMEERVTVSGGGSGSVSGKGSSYGQSWSWVLKDVAKPLGGGVSTAPDGLFSINLPSASGIKIEPQIHPGNVGGGPEQAVNASFGAMMLSPRVGPSVFISDPNFEAHLHGTYDPKSRSFSKSGSEHASAIPQRSTGTIPGLESVGNGYVDVTYTLSLNQEPEEVEAILIPDKGYQEWMPQGGSDEDTPGNAFLASVVLQKKGKQGQKPKAKAKSFKFELTGVSKEPGVCLNWPPKAKTKPDPDYDLKIDKAGNSSLRVASDGQSATSGPDLQDSNVIIFSYDWGAWGNLKVTAELDNGQTVVAHLQNKPDIELLSIPKDDNQNHIADVWEKQKLGKNASTSAEVDDDTGVWQELPQGDGLSLYEEYRGFRVQGSFLRTNPATPDVFVYDQDDIGTGYFAESGLSIHTVQRNEMDVEVDPDPGVKNWWVINFNGHYAHLGKQHAIWLKNEFPGNGLAGVDVGGPGPPRTSLAVKIGIDAMAYAGKGGVYMASTISHELAHAVNVWHHGDQDYTVSQVWKLSPQGQWVAVRPEQCKPCSYEVAAKGGQESGVEDCMMRYESSYFYEWDQGPLRWDKNGQMQRGDFYGPAQMSGRRYCRDLVGTGVNAPGHQPVPIAGNASRGGCMSQFCANDLKQCVGAPR